MVHRRADRNLTGAVLRAALAVFGAAFSGCTVPSGPQFSDVAVLYDPGGTIVTDSSISLTRTSTTFFSYHPDVYDFLVVFSLDDVAAEETDKRDVATYLTIRNDAFGIGFPSGYDAGAGFGSAGELEGIVFMGDLDRFWNRRTRTIDPMLSVVLAHEIGHRFTSYARVRGTGHGEYHLLDFGRNHWTFAMASGGSPMGGMQWRDNADGTFTALSKWRGAYSPLDLYFWGLLPAGEVGPIAVLDIDPRPDSVAVGSTLAVSADTFSIADIVAAEGTRRPAFGAAPTSWRAAFVLVARDSRAATEDAIAGVDAIRAFWETRFSELTGGRGTMITRLGP